MAKVTILGCGGSSGVPLIGNSWGTCDPNEPRNRRRRPSILLTGDDGTQVLVDTGPDMRDQLIGARVTRLDAVVYTHAHADHVHGIDDLRSINWMTGRPVPCWGDAATLDDLRQRFAYCFAPPRVPGHYTNPALEAHLIDGPFRIGDLSFTAFEQRHGRRPSLGLRVGDFAYSTDVVELDERAFAILEGVDTWVVDATRLTPHTAHAHLDLTLEWIARVRPRRAYLTHMNHEMDYRRLLAMLPAGVEPAYDGLEFAFSL